MTDCEYDCENCPYGLQGQMGCADLYEMWLVSGEIEQEKDTNEMPEV